MNLEVGQTYEAPAPSPAAFTRLTVLKIDDIGQWGGSVLYRHAIEYRATGAMRREEFERWINGMKLVSP